MLIIHRAYLTLILLRKIVRLNSDQYANKFQKPSGFKITPGPRKLTWVSVRFSRRKSWKQAICRMHAFTFNEDRWCNKSSLLFFNWKIRKWQILFVLRWIIKHYTNKFQKPSGIDFWPWDPGNLHVQSRECEKSLYSSTLNRTLLMYTGNRWGYSSL